MVEIIPQDAITKVLNDLGQWVVFQHQQRLKKQTGVDGSPFPALHPATVAQKERSKTPGVRINATKRMLATEKFKKHAFEYVIIGNTLTFRISDKIHKSERTVEKQLAYDTNKKKGRNMKKPRHTLALNQKGEERTYIDIALFQLSGGFGDFIKPDNSTFSWRNPNNPGANFFGLNEQQYNYVITTAKNALGLVAKTNINNAIGSILANANRR